MTDQQRMQMKYVLEILRKIRNMRYDVSRQASPAVTTEVKRAHAVTAAWKRKARKMRDKAGEKHINGLRSIEEMIAFGHYEQALKLLKKHPCYRRAVNSNC